MESAQTRSHGSVLAASFANTADAEHAMTELMDGGYDKVEISEAAGGERDAKASPAPPRASGPGFFQAHDSAASSFVDELQTLGFSKPDAHDLVRAMTGGGAVVTADAGTGVDAAAAILERHAGDVRYTAATGAAAGAARADAADADDRVIALREERLALDKQVVQHGEARIHKEVVTHIESIDVPVTREELVIEQVALSGDGTSEPIGAGDVVRIPLSEEHVNVTKSTHVVGDVHIGKRVVEETQHVSETTREERLRVDDATDPRAGT